MAQTPFNPTPGVSTHQDCVDTINANVTDAESRLGSLESAPPAHTHTVSEITDIAATYAPISHTHTVADLDSALAADGTVATADGAGNVTWEVGGGGGPSGTTLSGTTANDTPTEIYVDGTPTNRVDVATGSTITFSALVAARSATESAGYKIEGVIKNDAGTAELVGVVAKTVFAEEDIAWDITVTAANNALTFIVTGDSADSVSWEVTLNKTEAT